MEGLRGIAVLLVFLVHYVTDFEPWLVPGSRTLAIGESVRDLGHAGVDLFFTLSGFLIWRMLGDREFGFWDYVRRRVQRIYPTFLVVFVVYIAAALAAPELGKLPNSFGEAVTYLLQNALFLPGIFNIRPFVTVAWSLSYELCFYLAAPLVLVALRLKAWPSSCRVLFVLGCAIALLIAFSECGPIRLAMFLPGVLVAETLKAQRAPQRDSFGIGVFALAIGFAGVVVSRLENQGLIARFFVLGVAFYVTTLYAFGVQGATMRWFALTPLRWLGNISYSYYLVHGVGLRGFFLACEIAKVPLHDHPNWFWLFVVPGFLATLPLTIALYWFVERPFSLTPRA